MNSKITVLFYSSLTKVMIFFNGTGKYVQEMKKKAIVIVADVFAMIYVGFTFVDALIRCRFKHVRILDEIVLVSAFFSLWCFAFAVFEITSLWYDGVFEITSLWYAVGVTIGFLIVFAIICYRRTDPRVRLIESINNLNTLAIMAFVLKRDDELSEEIFRTLMKRAEALQSEAPPPPPLGIYGLQISFHGRDRPYP